MTTPPSPPPEAVQVMAQLAAAGVRLAPNGTNLLYWSPISLAPELRNLIITHKAAILVYLSIWSEKRALALGLEADGLVAESGVLSTDPEIRSAVARYLEALIQHDMVSVRTACFAIEDRVRKLSTPQNREESSTPTSDAFEDGEAAAQSCFDAAERSGWDSTGATESILAHLRQHGPTAGEVLVDETTKRYPPHDARAFGPIFLKLSRNGLIEKAGHTPREKGHGTAGGIVWKLVDAI